MSAYVPAGYTNRIFLVFDTPPTEPERRLTYELLAEAGYLKTDIAYTAAVRCQWGKAPTMKQLRCCRPFVIRAIDLLEPQHVFGLGASAMRSLTNEGKMTNIGKLRGRPITIHTGDDIRKCYATYSPTLVLAGGLNYKTRILEDFKRQTQEDVPYPALTLPDGSYVSVDTEYAPDKSLLTVGVANSFQAVSAEPKDDNFYEVLGHIDDRPSGSCLVGHSLTGDVDKLVELNLARKEWVDGTKTFDSLLLARMLDENRGKGGYDLEGLLTSDQNVKPWKAETEAYSKTDATQWPEPLRKERCRLDAWASASLVRKYCEKPELQPMPVILTHQIQMSLHRIRLAGVVIDGKKLGELSAGFRAERSEAQARLGILAAKQGMVAFSPTNDADIRELLYKRMKLPVERKTKGKGLPAVDKITLAQFKDKPEVDLLLRFNKADKAQSTLIEGIEELWTPDPDGTRGWMPVNINPLGARTGRRSSERPNMQNWPAQKDLNMRQLVVSRFPGGGILEYDYKSLEVFILAFEANDPKLFEYFDKRGGYIAIAKDMWGKDVQKGSLEYRSCKSVVLGTNYNMQTKKMARNLWDMGVKFSSDYREHEKQTDKLRNKYLDMFPGLRPYMRRQREYLLKNQCVVSRTGRVRHLPHDGEETPGFGHMVNQAINYPIQSLAADVTGSALVDCEKYLCEEYELSLVDYHERLLNKAWPNIPLPINEVHDSLVFDVPSCSAPELEAIQHNLAYNMTAVTTLRKLCPSFTMPLKVDMKFGPHWGMLED
jgi:uracil-DNA glycosylase family 4